MLGALLFPSFYVAGAINPTARIINRGDFEVAGSEDGVEVLEDPVGGGFLVDADVTVGDQVVFEGFELNACLIGDVFNNQLGKIGKSRKWADG